MSAKSSDPTPGGGGDGEATGNSEGGTTVALQKKRLRRVSFAEMTSVHFFDRDEEENERTSRDESASKVGDDDDDSAEKIELLGFRQLEESKGADEEDREDGEAESDDEERVDMRRSFLRPIESPSSGSAFGSATSNDEDNFFGPVSASFIRADRLSDSGASDVNHDVTMDSTAFSIHFRSLARSDLGADLKTPTGSHLSFEEKTPTQTNVGSSMELTVPKKLITQSSSPNRSGSSSSSDMSLVGGSPARYDYGRLSPGLDALLAEGSRNLNVISDSDIDVASRSRRNFGSKLSLQKENGSGVMDVTKNGKAVSKISGEANGGFPISPVAHAACEFSCNTSNKLALDVLIDKTNLSPNQSSKERTSRPHSDDKLGQADCYVQNESPLADFISRPAKRRELLTSSASPLKHMSLQTPQEQRGSFRCTETTEHNGAVSIQKSISKLKLLEASPFSSSLAAENQDIRPFDFSKSSPFNILSKKEMNNFQTKILDASSTGIQIQLLSDSHWEGVQVSTSSTENKCIEDPLGRGHMPQTEESNAAAVSPSHLISSGKKMKHNLFRSKDPNDSTLAAARVDSSSADVNLDYIGQKKLTGSPQALVPSPNKWLGKKLAVSSELQNKLTNDLVLHDRFAKLKNFSPGRNLALQGSALDGNLFAAPLDQLGSFAMGERVNPGSPALEISSSNLIEVNSSVDRNVNCDDGNGGIEMTEGSQSIHRSKLNGNLQSGIGLSCSTSELPGGKPEDASSGSFVPSVWRNLKELTFQKNLLDSFTQSPSREVFQIVGWDNNCVDDVGDVFAPRSSQMKSPSLKRRNEVFDLEGRERRNEVAAEQRSPKLLKVGCQDRETLECSSEDYGERPVVAHALKHWTDRYSKFSDDSERLLTTSVDKLNLSVIDLLEEFLFQLKKSKTYEMLGTGIFAQKTSVCHDHRSKRVDETRLLLLEVMHEKAKLWLMHAKQQRLLGKLQTLSSGIQESRMLKLKFLPKLRRGAQVLRIKQRNEVACDKVRAMEQALEAFDKRKANFTKALQHSCKIKGEPSCADTVILVNDQLMKRSHHRLIRQDMQIWVVDDVKSMNGHHDIVLNYLDLIIQRIKLAVGSALSIVISSKVDDTKIIKIFPNMDAGKAFSVVLNAERTQKYLGSRSLAQELQVTSSLLGNLVDVVRELQMAQIELRNLTETSFLCPLDGQLNLRLTFLSFKNGKKVSLVLDMSNLNRGIYPSEILPLQLTAFNGMNNTSADPVIGEIRDAVKILRTGYLRILRLCRCISLIVQGSSTRCSSR